MYRYAGYVLRIASHYDQNFNAVHSSYFQGMILYKQRMIGGCGMIKIRIPFEVGPYDAAQNINRVSKSPILITEMSASTGTGFQLWG